MTAAIGMSMAVVTKGRTPAQSSATALACPAATSASVKALVTAGD